ncbi:MAG: COR domain-containing protein [Bacteroidia bacterium]
MTSEPIIRQLEQKSGLTSVSAAEPQVLFRQWSEKTYSRDAEGYFFSLNLAGMQLTDDELASVWQMDLSHLQVLNLTENRLTSVRIPANLPQLKYLSLNENKELTHLSFENGLPALERLEANLCQLEKFALPKGFDSLTWLDLSRNKTLAECTFEGDCPALESLDLSGNGLTGFSLPKGFEKLEYLYLNSNKISELSFPPVLETLKTLHLTGNQLKNLEDNFTDYFPSLESLYLAENPLPDAIRGNVENRNYGNSNSLVFVSNYLKQLRQGRTPENECKVLLVGNGNVGKSCLVHRLVDNKFDERWNSTHAIVLRQYALDDWLLNIWDFGGQDIYHTTHRLFMQSNAVYLVLWDWETENKSSTDREEAGKNRSYKNYKLPYWLAYTKSQGQGSPAIVVQTKIGKPGHGKRDRADIREAFEKHFPFFDFSYIESKEEDPDENLFPELKLMIKKAIRRTKIKTDIPETWAKLRQEIRKLQAKEEKYISMEDFLQLAADVEEKDPIRVLLENWLVKTGVVFYRKGLFQDLIILDQERVIKAIYTIFDREKFYHELFESRKGTFSGKDLARPWKEHNDAERELFVSFMLSCEMCFETTKKKENQYSVPFEERTFIAPQLLPEQKPMTLEDVWEDRPSLFFRYRHEFLHYGVIQSFIVRTQSLAEQRDIWKLGIFIKEEKEKAMIETREKEIMVRVTTGGKKLLDKIRNLLEELQGKTGVESVSVDGINYVLLEKLKNHSPKNPQIDCENGEWVEYKLFEPFLHKDEQAKFDLKTETTDTMNIIQQLVTQERLSEAIQLLSKHLPSYQKNDAILLQSRLTNLKTNEGQGIISNDNANIERNRIKNSILQLAEGLSLPEADTFIKEEPVKPTPDSQPQNTAPSKILFLAANPTNESRLQTDTEHRLLKAEMERGRGRDKYSFLPPQFAVTLSELLRAMNDKPQIVHFAGHGGSKGIYITKENNESQLLPEPALKRLFKPLAGHTEIVILNACSSSPQAKAISEFGMYVVGNNIDVNDNAAISFTKGLYNGLGEGKSFEEAMNDALIYVLSENDSVESHIEVWKDGKKLDI